MDGRVSASATLTPTSDVGVNLFASPMERIRAEDCPTGKINQGFRAYVGGHRKGWARGARWGLDKRYGGGMRLAGRPAPKRNRASGPEADRAWQAQPQQRTAKRRQVAALQR